MNKLFMNVMKVLKLAKSLYWNRLFKLQLIENKSKDVKQNVFCTNLAHFRQSIW